MFTAFSVQTVSGLCGEDLRVGIGPLNRDASHNPLGTEPGQAGLVRDS